MNGQQFLNRYQPQTLQNATILLYIKAVFSLFSIGALFGGGIFGILYVGLAIAGGPAGYGIANDKKWGYQLGLAAAIGPLAALVYLLIFSGANLNLIISTLFAVMTVILLFHQQSKDYVKLWFK